MFFAFCVVTIFPISFERHILATTFHRRGSGCKLDSFGQINVRVSFVEVFMKISSLWQVRSSHLLGLRGIYKENLQFSMSNTYTFKSLATDWTVWDKLQKNTARRKTLIKCTWASWGVRVILFELEYTIHLLSKPIVYFKYFEKCKEHYLHSQKFHRTVTRCVHSACFQLLTSLEQVVLNLIKKKVDKSDILDWGGCQFSLVVPTILIQVIQEVGKLLTQYCNKSYEQPCISPVETIYRRSVRVLDLP